MSRLFHRFGRKRRDEGAAYSDNSHNIDAPQASTVLSLSERPKGRNDQLSSPTPPTTPSSSITPCAPIPQNDAHGKRQNTVLSNTNAPKKDYWQLAIDNLQKEDPSVADQIAQVQQAAAETGSTDFAAQLLHATEKSEQELKAKRWKLTTSKGEVVLREKLDRLLKVVTVFRDVAKAAGSLDPLHAGLPLAGFCVLMDVATNDSEQYAATVEGVEELVSIMARYRQIEALYWSRPETMLKQDFERRLVGLYKNIIHYQISARNYYQRNTTSRFLRAIPKLDDLSEVMASIRRDDTACWQIGQVFDSSDALERHQELLKKLDWLEKYMADQTNHG
ncbi:MAG: hypothetical protein LQ338_003382 [Usnochroma carphineum]|nr:MAG: hypothetical protein LQ338_003382 [Usnochroma carphineum]